MYLLLVGLNHETAPLAVRERVAFSPAGVTRALETLHANPLLHEVALLSTCNRTELYALLPTSDPAPLVAFLEATGHVPDLAEHLYRREGEEAARHLFRVASGVNSMILGEGQVLSQVRAAFQQANAAGTVGGRLSALFRHALSAGKRAREETGIARRAVSISSVAVQLARELFGDLKGHSALVLGAGETAELTLRLLSDAGVRSIAVTNRTYQHAVGLAESLGGRAVPFDALADEMTRANIVISSTAAPHTLIRREMALSVMRKRRGRPLFLIDIAVPRDIEPEVGDLENVFLYNIDDLKRVVGENLEGRAGEVAQVETLIEEEVARFRQAWRGLTLGPLLNALQEKMEAVRLLEMEKSARRLAGLSEGEREAVEALTKGMVRRMLKDPIAQLRSRADTSEATLYLDALRALFDLELPEMPTVADLLGEEAGEDVGLAPHSDECEASLLSPKGRRSLVEGRPSRPEEAP